MRLTYSSMLAATQLACACAYSTVIAPPALRHAATPARTASSVAAIRMQEDGGSAGSSGMVKGLWRQIVGNSDADNAAELARDLGTGLESELEYVPLVLVVGAAGRTGRLIVRKLVLQGFRVAVLVRSLGSETLQLLGTGVTYSYGDMTDYRALLDAMEDVDRVIFAADCEGDEEKELVGLQQVLRSFQDTRTYMYGDAEATKLTLLKMRRDIDFNRWQVEDSSNEAGLRLAAAGMGPEPSIAYWKRSPTKAHNNGVFVGKVFDTYLGSASVSCSLSSLLVGGSPVLSTDSPLLDDTTRTAIAAGAAEASAEAGSQAATATMAAAAAAQAAASDEAAKHAAAELNRAAAALAAKEVPLDLGEYSGINLRVLGDGKKYTCVLRTPQFAEDGLEYHADFETRTTSFKTVRLPFSNFVAVKGGRPVKGAAELDRRRLVGMGLAFYPQRNNPDTTTGEFYLSLSNVKAYRKRDEPEFVYISDAEVAPLRAKTAKARETLVEEAATQVDAASEVVTGGVPATTAAVKAAEQAAEEMRRAAAAAAQLDPSSADEEASVAGMSPEEAAQVRRTHTKRRGEMLLRDSGLTYFIVRTAPLDDRPSASTKLAFTQGAAKVDGSVSRNDIAEVVVRSLLDPRACNVACTVSETAQAAPSAFKQDISKALEVLEPNKL